MKPFPCPGCGQPMGDRYDQQQHESQCPAIYDPASAAYHELTQRKIDRLIGRDTP